MLIYSNLPMNGGLWVNEHWETKLNK